MILYFSGNGNTAEVAKLLGEELSESVVNLSGSLNKEHPLERMPVADKDRIIWAMPCHSWGVTPALIKFIKECEIANADKMKHYLVATCGDDVGDMAFMWRKIISTRGWKPWGTFSVRMPNTYVCLPGFDVDTQEIAKKKIGAMPGRCRDIARKISNEFRGDDMVRGVLPWFKTNLVYPGFVRSGINPRKFNVSAQCVSCGKCVKICPLQNIELNSGSPIWGARCTLCLGCYNVCPVHAINYGKTTLRKGQYNYSEFKASEL